MGGGGQVGPKFWENPCSAGAFCRDFTEKNSPQCRAYTWALQTEKSISPLFPGPEGAVVANDWCIIFTKHILSVMTKSPIKWRQRPDITIAVDWDVKHQFKHITCIKLSYGASVYFTA